MKTEREIELEILSQPAKAKHTPTLLGYREIVEKDGIDLDDIFYVRSFVRLLDNGYGYTVDAHRSGSGREYFIQSYATLNEAQKVYDTVKGSLAIANVTDGPPSKETK